MPTYDYQCRKCGHKFEKFQSMTAKPDQKCPQPKCGGKVERLIGSGGGVLFKGSGFYQTDYRSLKYKEAAQKEKPSKDSKSSPPSSSGSSGSNPPSHD